VPGLSRSCFTFALLCSAGACSVYGPDLMNGSALSSAGTDGVGGDGTGTTGGTAGNSNSAGASAQGGSAAGSAAQAGAGETGGDGSVSGGAGGMAGSAGTGTTAGSGGSAGASNLDLIDNLEDNDGSIRLLNNPKRDGIWDSGNDMTSGGTQTPLPGKFKPILLSAANAPYAGDKYAAYSKASGFTSYGAFMNVSMRSWPNYDTTYPKYDASANKGISFLAKAGTGSSLGMRVRFISGDTDPRGGKCKINPASAPNMYPLNQLCYNHYFAEVTLSNDWATYTLNFTDDFGQGMDGMVNPTIDLTEMYGLEFYFSASNDFELWIDDLSFIKN